MKNQTYLIILLLLISQTIFAQGIQGKIFLDDVPIECVVNVSNTNANFTISSNYKGDYFLPLKDTGRYIFKIKSFDSLSYVDTILINRIDTTTIANLNFYSRTYDLKSVDIIKLISIAQNNDTTTFNANSFKTNADADVSELIRKMPAVEINDNQIKFQGELVSKVLIDGKPFFGNDPYKALKTLPKDIVQSIKVYDEKNEQEQFSGFKENGTTKTINIITKSGVSESYFGNANISSGSDNNAQQVYNAELNFNKFTGDKRFTTSVKFNNVNNPNYSSVNLSNGGIQKTNSIGINFNNKVGLKSDVAFSYSYNESDINNSSNVLRRYFTSIDSGQVYNELNKSINRNDNHAFDMRLNLYLDTFTSILFQPKISYLVGNSSSDIAGNTFQESNHLNSTNNQTFSNQNNLNFQNNLLIKRAFPKRGRTVSLNINTNTLNNKNQINLSAQNLYFVQNKSDSLKQQNAQSDFSTNIVADLNLTEPIGAKGLFKVLYQTNYLNANTDKNLENYSALTNSYSIQDSLLSGKLNNLRLLQKMGASYMLNTQKILIGASANYQYTTIKNNNTPPNLVVANQNFENILFSTNFQYQFSKQKSLRFDYRAQTQAPNVSQLQNIIVNNNPLHLTLGNPALKQSLTNNFSIKYNAVNKINFRSFNSALSFTKVQNAIANNSIIPTADTTINNVYTLHTGSTLTLPVNVNGNYNLTLNANYGSSIKVIKCYFNIGLNATRNMNTGIVNSIANKQINQTINLRGQLSSNLNESIDFILLSQISLISNKNSLNPQLSRNYIASQISGTCNALLSFNLFVNSSINFNTNSGLSANYNQNYILWNCSIGKKVFRHKNGEFRLSVFDLLNSNKNIKYFTAANFEQTTQSTIIQRYFLLGFHYKFSTIR